MKPMVKRFACAGLECRRLIDDKPTITGNMDSPVEIPGTGQESVIPSRLSLDAQPTVSMPLGPITYPGRATIISAEFR